MGNPGAVCCLLSGRVVWPSPGTHTHLIKHVMWLLSEALSASGQRVDLVYTHPNLEVASSAVSSWGQAPHPPSALLLSPILGTVTVIPWG